MMIHKCCDCGKEDEFTEHIPSDRVVICVMCKEERDLDEAVVAMLELRGETINATRLSVEQRVR